MAGASKTSLDLVERNVSISAFSGKEGAGTHPSEPTLGRSTAGLLSWCRVSMSSPRVVNGVTPVWNMSKAH